MASYAKHHKITCRWCKQEFVLTVKRKQDEYNGPCRHCRGSNPIDNSGGFIAWIKNKLNKISEVREGSSY